MVIVDLVTRPQGRVEAHKIGLVPTGSDRKKQGERKSGRDKAWKSALGRDTRPVAWAEEELQIVFSPTTDEERWRGAC